MFLHDVLKPLGIVAHPTHVNHTRYELEESFQLPYYSVCVYKIYILNPQRWGKQWWNNISGFNKWFGIVCVSWCLQYVKIR